MSDTITSREKIFNTSVLRKLISNPKIKFDSDSEKTKLLDIVFDPLNNDSLFLVTKSIGSFTKIHNMKIVNDELFNELLGF